MKIQKITKKTLIKVWWIDYARQGKREKKQWIKLEIKKAQQKHRKSLESQTSLINNLTSRKKWTISWQHTPVSLESWRNGKPDHEHKEIELVIKSLRVQYQMDSLLNSTKYSKS